MSEDCGKPPLDIVSARYRTATSPLRRLPLVMSRHNTLHSRLGAEGVSVIYYRAVEVLKAFKLIEDSDDYDNDDYDVDISMWETKDCPETTAPTIMIYFKVFPTDREALHKATKQIADFARDSSDEPFCVDMIGQPLVWTVAYGPVRDRPDLLQCWDKMRVLVYERLEAHEATGGSMTSISLFYYGTKRIYGNNPVTIFLTVDFDSQEVGWPDVIEDIEKSLKENHLPALYIHIEHNVGFSSAPPSLLDPEGESSSNRIGRGYIEKAYNRTVNLGEAIGPANFVMREDWTEGYPGHGNLGCYVEVKTAAGSWEKYGLTNYHVVRGAFPGFNTTIVNNETILATPSAQSALLTADKDGLRPGSHESLYSMESPPRSLHDYTLRIAQRSLDSLNRSLQRLRDNPSIVPDPEETYARVDGYKVELIQEVEKKKDFFYFYHSVMGEIFAASGFNKRTPEKGRLDLALIKVDECRAGTNILPDRLAWESALKYTWTSPYFMYLPPGRQLQPQQPSISLEHESQKQCEEGYTYGTTTDPACGQFHPFKTDIKIKDDQHIGHDPVSSEYLFQMRKQGRDEPFAGSIVFDKRGCVLGLLSRGLQPQNAGDFHVYVTPIEHVFRHIKESSNGKIVDIRVAQDQSS
ncbi:unnamed protein product [Fusarium equiseti]|uniref:Uncharacterized protein n=1 Tax=Fusarium equiseti TaxID=61235 RepID=A0A8J2NP34_FUSEQ|nr:unnamed protein product [Fusarium equiseti]